MFEYRVKNKDKWVNVAIPNGFYDEEGLNYFLKLLYQFIPRSMPNQYIISSNLATIKFLIILRREL
jgi:hypothetical protein